MRPLRVRRPWFECSDGVFFVCPFTFLFCSSVETCTMIIEVMSEQSRIQFYMHTECCCCCRCCCSVYCLTAVVAAAAVLLLPAARRHRMPDGQICCWFVESDPSVFFFFIKRDFFFMVPLGSTVPFTASICLHPR